jgi:hypothetical protein
MIKYNMAKYRRKQLFSACFSGSESPRGAAEERQYPILTRQFI